MKLKRAKEIDRSETYSQILLMGFSGSGKTWKGASACDEHGTVFGILTEPNGVNSALHANPELLLPTFEDQGDDGSTIERHFCKTLDEVRECIRFCASGEARAEGVSTIFLDGATEIQQMRKAEVMADKQVRLKAGRISEELAKTYTQQDWGELRDWMIRMMSRLRALPYDFVCTVLADYSTDDNQQRWLSPMLQGSAQEALPSFFTAVAYCFQHEGDYLAMFEGSERIRCKSTHPLGGVTAEPVSSWLSAIRTGEEIEIMKAPRRVVGAPVDEKNGSGSARRSARRG